MSREERIEELVQTDENFRLLAEIVKRHNNGRIPSAEEIDEHVQVWRDRRASS